MASALLPLLVLGVMLPIGCGSPPITADAD
jgi:hypothetical protein